MSKSVGLERILQDIFPDKWEEILTCAIYMVCEGNVMMYMDDWLDMTETTFSCKVNSKRSSELFSSISYEERLEFFSEWVNHRTEQEYIAYDVTSISTYSKGIEYAEWGYNRDKEEIPQLNIGMYYGESSGLPVYYNIYSGSISDKSELVFMLENTERLGIKNIRFVLDRGFVTEENIRYMNERGYPFIVPLPASRQETVKLIGQVQDCMRNSKNWIEFHELYGTAMEYEIYGIKTQVHIFFNTEKCSYDEKGLYSNISRLASELEKLKKSKSVGKRYTEFFNVEKERGAINYKLNHDKINERLKRAGFFVFLTTDLATTSEELIQIYCNRDVVEKSFDCLKNEIDFKRMRTHYNRTAEGKIFVGFIALILRSMLLSKTREKSETKKQPIEKILLELKKIKVITLNDGKKMLMPLTQIQKEILGVLGISDTTLLNSV
jgi:transposase